MSETKFVRAFVLLSGGLDSSVTLAQAAHDLNNLPEGNVASGIEAITINYGQRHIVEAQCARYQAAQVCSGHSIISLEGLMTGMLVGVEEAIPKASYADLPEGISPTYVSFRNGTMLSVLAARAQSWVMQMQKYGHDAHAVLYTGVHADDAARDAYPDCTLEFVGAMAAAIRIGTYDRVRLRTPLVHMEKSDVVRLGHRLGVDFAHTWSCYVGGEVHCGECPTCISRKDAFAKAGIADPTTYLA